MQHRQITTIKRGVKNYLTDRVSSIEQFTDASRCSADQTRISKRENKKNKNILNQLSKIVQSSSIDFGEAPGEVRPG